jgi:hypothetical protein
VRENRQHGSEGGEGESPFRPLSIRFIMYSSYHVWGMHQAGLYTPVVRIKKPATGCTCGRLLRTIAHEDFLQRDERVRIRMDFPLCRFDHVRIKE